jgi:hypothetical protein
MKTLLALLLVSASAVGCGSKTDAPSEVRFDAHGSVALDAVIDAGRAVVSRPEAARGEIARQLFYAIGQLNGVNAGAEMQRVQIKVVTATARADGLYDAFYTARLFVAWPRESPIPHAYTVVLPSGGDTRTLSAFFQRYGTTKRCLDDAAVDVNIDNIWYWYRPLKPGCPLTWAQQSDLGARMAMRLQVSAANTENKYPEYGKVWEDGRLTATAIFSKNKEFAQSETDEGVVAYRSFYSDLVAAFGRPTATSLPGNATPGLAHPKLALAFETPSGPLDVHVFLVESLSHALERDAVFVDSYGKRTLSSDFVAYSGHSGFGANVQRLSTSGRFTPGKYQIFLLNGCDSFAYVDTALRDAHHAANPSATPHKYYDVITNAMPSFFHMNATATMAVLRALVGKHKTYRQLLGDFDPKQRATVMGEEDNTWPAPF